MENGRAGNLPPFTKQTNKKKGTGQDEGQEVKKKKVRVGEVVKAVNMKPVQEVFPKPVREVEF